MILTHYSEKELIFDKGYVYGFRETSKNRHVGLCMKPRGLWLSDDNDFGWKEWCEGEGFRTETLKYVKKFKVDLSDILVIDNDRKLLDFHKTYAQPIEPDYDLYTAINWRKVEGKYKGVLISPYSWELRLHPGMLWYYGWDCASACVWDLTAVEEVEE